MDFPANSRKASETEAREKLKPVTSAEAVRRKQGLGRRFKETFFVGTGKDAIGFMIEDVVVPTIRDMFREAMQGGIDRLIYGDSRRPHRTSRSAWTNPSVGQPQVNYQGMSTSAQTQSPPRTLSRRSRARHDFDDLVIPSAQEANEVIDQMFDVLSRYGSVSVADLYELTGIQSSHTDMKWGWTNLRGAKAVRLRQGGFLLDLPAPEALN